MLTGLLLHLTDSSPENGVADTLREPNRRLFGELGRGQFVALAYARVSADAATVELANAGMPDPSALLAASAPGAGLLSAGDWLDGVLDQAQSLTGPTLDDDWTAVAVERRRGESA